MADKKTVKKLRRAQEALRKIRAEACEGRPSIVFIYQQTSRGLGIRGDE